MSFLPLSSIVTITIVTSLYVVLKRDMDFYDKIKIF